MPLIAHPTGPPYEAITPTNISAPALNAPDVLPLYRATPICVKERKVPITNKVFPTFLYFEASAIISFLAPVY